MLSPPPEEVAAGAGTPPPARLSARSLGLWRGAWLAAAAVWCLIDAAVALDGVAPVDAARLVPWCAVACGLAVRIGIARATPLHRQAATADLLAAALLLGAAGCGVAELESWRVGMQAAALGLLLVGAWASAPRRALLPAICLAAAGAVGGGVAATGWLPCLQHGGSRTALQVAGVLTLLALAAGGSAPAAAVPRRRDAVLAVACLPLLWCATPTLPWVESGAPGAVLAAAGIGAVLAAITGGAAVLAFVLAFAFALTTLGGWWPAPSDAASAARQIPLARQGAAAATYERATQSLLLSVGGEVVDRAGPDHIGAELAATLVRLLAAPGDRVLVLGAGTGRLPDALLRSGLHEVEVVDARGDVPALRTVLAGDGPVPVAAVAAPDRRLRAAVQPWPAALAALPPASRQAIVVAESPHAAAPLQATVELQRALRRVAGGAPVLQALALDLVPAGRLRAVLAAAAAAHAWNAVVAVGDAAVLVSAMAPPRWPAEAAMAAWDADARWLAHRAHLGGVADVRRALLGTVAPTAAAGARSRADAPEPDGPRGRRAALAVLHELLQPAPFDGTADPHSLLLRWLGQAADLRIAATEIARLGGDPADAPRAQAIAARFLPLGAPSACLQAALGLPGADGAPLLDPALASRRAHAIDPTLWLDLPPVLQHLPRPVGTRGDLEDLARLPPRSRLAEACAGDKPTAVALRVRFGPACARALVEALAAQPLSPAANEALRELADPFVLAEAARVLRARGGLPELLSLWRRDLPMPVALADLVQQGDEALRLRLVQALGGRTDADSLAMLADCLAAPAVELRRAAALALRATVGDRIAYDPEWPTSALNEAADRVRALHNRAP
jgi:hypothetical protein